MNEEELLLKDKENYNDVYEKVFSNENWVNSFNLTLIL